jgi:hypothetical protein
MKKPIAKWPPIKVNPQRHREIKILAAKQLMPMWQVADLLLCEALNQRKKRNESGSSQRPA